MIETRAYHGLQLTIAKNGKDKVCYFLLPEGLKEDGIKALEEASEKYQCNIVLICGMDWNNDLTPWPAEGVFKSKKPFAGHALTFFGDLKQNFIPGLDAILGLVHPKRYLFGVSLSGLFAVWTLSQPKIFDGIASISGSLWYDGFADWAETHINAGNGTMVHISLGDKEKDSKDPRLAKVEDSTVKVTEILRGKGCLVDFQIVPGTHFSPIVPRLITALESIVTSL